MAYNQNIPQTTDLLKNSQPQLQANFQAISTLVAVNHVPFDDPSGDQGKHKFVTYPQQAGDPATAATEINMYNKSIGGANEIFIKKGTGTAYPVTQMGGPSGMGVAGWAYLPSGQKLKWGSANTGGTGSVTVNVSATPGGSPTINSIQSVQLTGLSNATFWVTNVSTGNITVQSSVVSSTFSYLVIGL